MAYLEYLTIDEFAEHLVEEGIEDEVVKTFEENRFSGAVFLQLQEDDLKELVPVIGDRVKVRQLLREATQVGSSVYKLTKLYTNAYKIILPT